MIHTHKRIPNRIKMTIRSGVKNPNAFASSTVLVKSKDTVVAAMVSKRVAFIVSVSLNTRSRNASEIGL